MTEASAGTGSPSRTALPAGPVWQAGLLAALAAVIVNGLVWVLLQQVLDVGLQIPSQPGGTELTSLPLSAVLFITAFSSLVGAVVLWLLTRRGPSGVRLWAILAVAFGALSALPAFGLDTSIGRRLGLVLFHLLATVVVIAVVRQQLARWTSLVELCRPGTWAGEGGPEELDGGGVEATEEAGPDQVVGGGEAGEQ
jgi:hypothetical protein